MSGALRRLGWVRASEVKGSVVDQARYSGAFGGTAPHKSSVPNSLGFSWRHPAFFACLNAVATSAIEVPFRVMSLKALSGRSSMLTKTDAAHHVKQRTVRSDWPKYLKAQRLEAVEVDPSHPLPALLDRVNNLETWPYFIQLTIMHLYGTGDAYWELEGGLGDQAPTALWILPPDNMRPVPDPKVRVKGWEMDVNGKKISLDTSQVLHFKMPHPESALQGLGRAEVLDLVLKTDWNRAIFNNTFFEHGARLGGIISPKDNVTPMDADAFRRAVQDFNASMAGVQNMGKIVGINGPVEFTETQVKPKDAEFTTLKRDNDTDISAVTGVGGALVGRTRDVNRSNYEAEMLRFWSHTMVPVVKMVVGPMNEFLCPRFGADLYIEADFDDVKALQEEAAARESRNSNVFMQGGITLNEYRAAIGFDPLPEVVGNVLHRHVTDDYVSMDELIQNPGAGGAAHNPAPVASDGTEAVGVPPGGQMQDTGHTAPTASGA